MMKRTIVAAALLAGAALTAQAAEVILYERPGFDGRTVTLKGYMQDLATVGFDGHASSIAVRSGNWEVCTEADFRGFCAILQPGDYRRLDPRFNNRIASAREVDPQGVRVTTLPVPDVERGSIELFGQRNFRGRAVTIERDAPTLDAYDFNDRTSSVVVREGRWEVCSDAGFRGTCRVLEPGQYAELGTGLANEISSVRMLRSRVDDRATVIVQPPPVAVAPPLPPSRPRIVLYDRDAFGGRSLVVSDNLEDLSRSSFNNDAASIVVESGSWEVCSDTYFRGRCQVLPPGEYRRLDSPIYRSISSVRPAGYEHSGRAPTPLAVELYEGINFDGRRFQTERDVPSLDARGFNDRASSMIIHEGQWEVCRDAGYNGRCNVYGPGRYADLGRFNNEVSSMRRIR